MDTTGRRRIWQLLIPLSVLAVVVPFYGKPPHIDEESYLFIGEAIRSHLLRPYDWGRVWQPAFDPSSPSFVYAHPPLFLWITSLAGRFNGFDAIVAMRASMLPFCLLAIMSFHRMAIRLVQRPSLATLAFLGCPAVLLVLHQSLMIDLPFIALSMAFVALLLEASFTRRPDLYPVAGGVLGLAVLTKYPAVVLLPLAWVALEPSARATQPRQAWRVAAGAAALVVPWQLWTWHVYGTPHLAYVLMHAHQIARSALVSRTIGTLAQLGMTVLSPTVAALALWPRRGRWRYVMGALITTGGVMAGVLSVPAPDAPPYPGFLGRLADDLVGEIPHRPDLLALLAAGLFLGVWPLCGLRLQRGPDRFLTVWAGLTLATALLTHNFTGARYLVPAAAPLHLLLWRRLEREKPGLPAPLAWAAVLVGGVLSLWVAIADLQLAKVYPAMGLEVGRLVEREGARPGDVWFVGEWGFRREMERRGYRFLPPGARPGRGALLVVPSVAGPGRVSGIEPAELIAQRSFGAAGLRTLAPLEGIGYYSDVFGLLPYGWGSTPLETVSVWRVR